MLKIALLNNFEMYQNMFYLALHDKTSTRVYQSAIFALVSIHCQNSLKTGTDHIKKPTHENSPKVHVHPSEAECHKAAKSVLTVCNFKLLTLVNIITAARRESHLKKCKSLDSLFLSIELKNFVASFDPLPYFQLGVILELICNYWMCFKTYILTTLIHSFQPVMPLLAGGLHSCFPRLSILCHPGPHSSGLLFYVVSPPPLRPSFRPVSLSWCPFHCFLGPLVVVYSSKMSCPLAFHVLYFFDDVLHLRLWSYYFIPDLVFPDDIQYLTSPYFFVPRSVSLSDIL